MKNKTSQSKRVVGPNPDVKTGTKQRATKILRSLRRLYPSADCALHHDNPFELLIATILSAQSTDDTVNKATPQLFRRFSTPQTLAKARPSTIEKIIHSTGFFRQKTKSIIGTSVRLVSEFGGQVPVTMDDLLSLPGVARKTANVVLGTAFGKNDGVVVDTHVGRLSTRLGLTWTSRDSKDAVKIERDLMNVIPQTAWTYVSHALIQHGRLVCTAKKPDCTSCTLSSYCVHYAHTGRELS